MSRFAHKSFWLGADPYTPDPPLAGPQRVDVAVIGGGFAGLSTAYHVKAAAPDKRVVVLESDVVGYGASGRNAGFAMTLFGFTLEITKLRFGATRAKEAFDFMSQAVDHVVAFTQQHSIDCDLEKTGYLAVATTPAYRQRLEHELALAESLGIRSFRWLDEGEMRARVNSPTYLGARWDPQCALLNPAKLSRGLKRVAQAAGVEVYEATPVLTFTPGRQRLLIETPGGVVDAEKVVFATNAYAVRFPQLQNKQWPVFTYIVLTEPLSERQLAEIGWRGREGVEDARNLIHYYRLTADNRLLMGGSDVQVTYGGDLNRDIHAPTFAQLERDIVTTFPALRGVKFTHRWGGPVSVPLDFAPAFGYLGGDRRIVYSLGCVGHGVSLMNYAGLLLRDLVLEQDSDLTRQFFVNRFVIPLPPEPLRFAAAQAIRGALQAEDRWHEHVK